MHAHVLQDVLHLLRLRLLRSCLQCRHLMRIARRWLPRVHGMGPDSATEVPSGRATRARKFASSPIG